MKKSKIVKLVLITAALAATQAVNAQNGATSEWGENTNGSSSESPSGKKVYMRSDTSAPYTRTHHSGFGGLAMFYLFRPYGLMGGNGIFSRGGFHAGGLSQSSNVGRNPMKARVARGGFGRTQSRVSS
jgi:hypothetical protein